MNQENLLIAAYSLAVVASSLFGGWLPSLFHLTHVRMQLVLSFVGGMMLGVGVLHMLPHSYVQTGSLDVSLNWMLVGLLGMFLLIRTFHFHEHGPAVAEDAQESTHDASHAHDHHDHGTSSFSTVSWLGVAFGLSLHAFLDGVALSAGVISEASHGTVGWAGFGIFVAILLHKPLDALSITTLMQARHWSHRSQQVVNAGFAMMCPLGAFVFAWWVDGNAVPQHQLVGIALAISAGIFLCISLSDLLPEVQFHRHDRLKLSAALIFGVLCAYGIGFLEHDDAHHLPGNTHHHSTTTEP